MYGVILLFLGGLFIVFLLPKFLEREKPEKKHSAKYNAQMKKLWSVAQSSMKERKPLRAEKALLTILKFDEKNAAAYNRLGILYAKEQKFDEAIECFEIAQSLDSNPSSLHNVGLIYLETGAYEKAAMAFEQAIEIEGDVPARYIALAKANEKLGNRKAALSSLESAYALDRSTTTLRQILAIYEAAGDEEGIATTTERIKEQLAANAAVKKKPAAKSKAKLTAKRPTQKPRRVI
ncbi:tetratricopeptide repeat protein [Candidatus Saccharibacteria bacterium]|nr:tetratricopeptide repeat protein [Candidatus Saccharibacteria bacterium]